MLLSVFFLPFAFNVLLLLFKRSKGLIVISIDLSGEWTSIIHLCKRVYLYGLYVGVSTIVNILFFNFVAKKT